MKRLFKTTLIVTAFISVQIFAVNWPNFAGNAANSAATTDYATRELDQAQVINSADLGIKNSSAPVVADGKVYVYANGFTGTIYCLDAIALTSLWTAPVMVNDTGWGSWATPAVGCSSIVFAADSFLGCWNLDGTERWSVVLSNQVGNGSCKIIDGKIIVPCLHWINVQQSLSAYDIETGSNLWNVTDPALNFAACTPAIDASAGKGYACAGTKAIQFDLANGIIGWNVELPDATGLQNVSINNDNLFIVDYAFGVTSAGSNIYSVSKADGSVNWVGQVNVSDVPPAIYNDALIHSAGDEFGVPRELTGLDINAGTQLWQVAGLGGWTLMPAVSKGVVFASDNNTTNLSCVKVADGTVLSSVVSGGGSPAIADDRLYTAVNGILYCYSGGTYNLNVDKSNAKIMLVKNSKDGAKLSASLNLADSPANLLSRPVTLNVGGIVFLDEDNGEMKTSDKKVIWKYQSPDKTAKATIKWIAKKQVLQVKASVKKSNLRGSIPYSTQDGTKTSDIKSVFIAGDFDFYAKSVDSMTTTTKKDKVKLKYKK